MFTSFMRGSVKQIEIKNINERCFALLRKTVCCRGFSGVLQSGPSLYIANEKTVLPRYMHSIAPD